VSDRPGPQDRQPIATALAGRAVACAPARAPGPKDRQAAATAVRPWIPEPQRVVRPEGPARVVGQPVPVLRTWRALGMKGTACPALAVAIAYRSSAPDLLAGTKEASAPALSVPCVLLVPFPGPPKRSSKFGGGTSTRLPSSGGFRLHAEDACRTGPTGLRGETVATAGFTGISRVFRCRTLLEARPFPADNSSTGSAQRAPLRKVVSMQRRVGK